MTDRSAIDHVTAQVQHVRLEVADEGQHCVDLGLVMNREGAARRMRAMPTVMTIKNPDVFFQLSDLDKASNRGRAIGSNNPLDQRLETGRPLRVDVHLREHREQCCYVVVV